MEELPFDGPAFEHSPVGRIKLVEASRQQRTQCRRHIDVLGLASHREHLRQEKGIAAGSMGNSLAQLGRQARDQLVGRLRRQRFEPEGNGPVRALCEELGAGHAHEQERRRRGEQRHALD